MKPAQIREGKAYRNGSGSVREVLGYRFSSLRLDPGIEYRLLAVGRNGSGTQVVGEIYTCTRASFAQWAVGEVGR